MKVYRTDEIRNVVLLGHGGSGKTSLAEAMAYVSGATNRMGKITDGNTISDFDKEEQKREFSLISEFSLQFYTADCLFSRFTSFTFSL